MKIAYDVGLSFSFMFSYGEEIMMARPRIFISSTYFDLKSVRADLEHFIREKGYDSVLHERGSVPYGNAEALEKYCYKEIESCDILISIVGGRYGSKSEDSEYSISQTELKVALEQQKQVYIFVDRAVYHEYNTYEKNRDLLIKWASVDNVRIYEFLSEIYRLKNNNPVSPFETSFDIVAILKEQWAGLFQRLLIQQVLNAQASIFQELKQTLDTAKSLVDVIASQTDQNDSVVAEIILLNHPFLAAVRKILNVPYRFVIDDIEEFGVWMRNRGFRDGTLDVFGERYEWNKTNTINDRREDFSVDKNIFEDTERLKRYTAATWQDAYVQYSITSPKKAVKKLDPLDDDIPF